MKNTTIEWTDHTLNFWWGCTKVSPACQHCYAESVAKVFGKRLFGTVPLWGSGKPRYERLEAARKEALAMNKKAAHLGSRPRVFVNSMSDWLDDEVPLGWLAFLLETLSLCPNLDFQVLTKRPENWAPRVEGVLKHIEGQPSWETAPADAPECKLRNFLADWFVLRTPPPNVWLGTTVENQEQANKRIPHLLEIPARRRFLSCEPLLGLVDIRHIRIADDQWFPLQHLHWVIAGGESGGAARPMHPEWLRSLRDQCAAAQVPFLFKQWGEWISVDNTRHCQSEAARLDKGYPGHTFPDGTLMLRLGDKHTGNNLDGQQHLNFPA